MWSADEDIDSKFPTNIVVSSDGTCSWVPPGLFISSCPIDITWFPFDDQNCTMKFGSWTYDGSKINLTNMYDSIDINTYKLNGEWKLLGNLCVPINIPIFIVLIDACCFRFIYWKIVGEHCSHLFRHPPTLKWDPIPPGHRNRTVLS